MIKETTIKTVKFIRYINKYIYSNNGRRPINKFQDLSLAVDMIQHIMSVLDEGEHLEFHENCCNEGHSLL